MFHLFRWLREAGILICTISLLLLPWLNDPYPSDGVNPVVMGTEFLAVHSPVIIGAFICLWLAYLISHSASDKWLAALSFFIGFLLYYWAYFSLALVPDRSDPWGIPLDRVVSYPGDRTYDLLVGSWLNILGVLLLLAGLIQAERKPNGKIFILTGSGVILGLGLFWGLFFVFGDKVFYDTLGTVVLLGMASLPIIGGLISFHVTREHMRHHDLPLSP
jgi:hypothetical protein